MKKCLSLMLALVMVCSCVMLAHAENYTTYVRAETEAGTIQGYNYDGVNAFLGVPYATAERFQMPQKVAPWEGVRLAMFVGDVAPANKTTTSGAEFITPSGIDNVENEATCLNLNIWTPSMDPDAKLPVIFWIHGGGYSSGSSIELSYYWGYNLAATGEAVFVSINHRLNVLGYLDLSACGEEWKYTGNLGQYDIIAALHWVHDNIGSFGGDPANVTIDGQSGGGGKVMTLLGMPDAVPLFAKAIVQSGGVSSTPQANSVAATAQMMENLGLTQDAEGVAALKAMPYVELLAAANAARAGSGPVVDGEAYPAPTVADGKWTDLSVDKPVMIGTALTEIAGNNVKNIARTGRFPADGDLSAYSLPDMSEEKFRELLTAKFGDRAEEALEAFKKAYPDMDPRHILFTVARNDNNVAAKAACGGTAYSYVFAYVFPVFGGCAAWHTGGDIPFFFRNVDMVDYLIIGDRDGAHSLQDAASRALLNFLKTGDPSQDGIAWEPYTPENGAVMVFDADSQVEYFHDAEFQAILSGN
ncbi:MAG: carboxylesterase/lipase family protein [Clostridia bacterium]|nr:carboxylesterase/lipase family protein [Clostridia bacterium]